MGPTLGKSKNCRRMGKKRKKKEWTRDKGIFTLEKIHMANKYMKKMLNFISSRKCKSNSQRD